LRGTLHYYCYYYYYYYYYYRSILLSLVYISVMVMVRGGREVIGFQDGIAKMLESGLMMGRGIIG